jgi:hypothetical protein
MGYYGTGASMTGYYGDPSFWGALKGAVVGYVTSGFNPAGAVVGAIGGSMGTPSTTAAAASSMPQVGMPGGAGSAYGAGYGAGQLVRRGIGFVRGHPVLTGAAAAGTIALTEHTMLGAGHPALAGGGRVAGARGYHMTKPHRCGGQVIPSHPARNRRMNVCNPRALRRAVRRAHGFTKLAMRTIHLVHPKKHARFGGFKKRRRRA